MTITFKCPGCGGLCAFADKYAGRRARCWKCNEVFIIPSEDGQAAKKVKPEPEEPVAGFYRAAIVGKRKLDEMLDVLFGV